MLQVKCATGIVSAQVVFIAYIAMLQYRSTNIAWHRPQSTTLVIERLEDIHSYASTDNHLELMSFHQYEWTSSRCSRNFSFVGNPFSHFWHSQLVTSASARVRKLPDWLTYCCVTIL